MSVTALTVATKLPSAGVLVLALLAAVVVIGALAVLMRRRPDALPLLAVFALPFRLPISTGGRTVNLLIPLYLVVAAGAVALLIPAVLEVRRTGSWRAARPRRELAFWVTPAGMTWLLGASVLLYALQSTYSSDATKAAENLLFFYLPFGLLFVLLSMVRWRPELLARCLAIVVAEAILFAGVGFVEYARKSLFLNPKVVAANQFDNYFRVNSVFFDPNIYGRFLALVMIAVSTVVLWTASRRTVIAGACVLAWLLAGLVTSFSQSSIAALLLGLAVLGGLALGRAPDADHGRGRARPRAGSPARRRPRACTSG